MGIKKGRQERVKGQTRIFKEEKLPKRVLYSFSLTDTNSEISKSEGMAIITSSPSMPHESICVNKLRF